MSEFIELLEEALSRAENILNEYCTGLNRVVEALREKEQIFGAELMALLKIA